jgi:homoserine dehydrogenase
MPGQVKREFPITVLKFGGSVLAREHDLARAVHEVYRWVREGQRVVAVVSALGRTTDRLLAQAHHYGPEPDAAALAALVATGEQTSAALLGLALDRAGVPAEVLDAARIGLRTSGPVRDAEPVGVNSGVIVAALERVPVVVVPGFLGRDEQGRTTLLGRGGSDFSALFLAHALGAERCRLVKDVAGLYEHDPARPGPLARVYRELSWDDCLRLDGRIVQHKAVRWARERGVGFEVASLNGTRATVVGECPPRLGPTDAEGLPPMRVGLLGWGRWAGACIGRCRRCTSTLRSRGWRCGISSARRTAERSRTC